MLIHPLLNNHINIVAFDYPGYWETQLLASNLKAFDLIIPDLIKLNA